MRTLRSAGTASLLGTTLLLTACGAVPSAVAPSSVATPLPGAAPAAEAEAPPAAPPDASPRVTSDVPSEVTLGPAVGSARPDWLGTRPLPLAADGFGIRPETPAELVDRRFPPPVVGPAAVDLQAPPADGRFRGTVAPVTPDVLARSTWVDGCPVTPDELRHLTVTFIGFDDRAHTGELLVHRDVATAVVDVFRTLHAARFPIEELRIIRREELGVPPTGDGNVTSAFVCRPTVGGTRWSDHASGRAIDVNPFHNPYVRGELVLPELASAYTDRSVVRPGMIVPGDVVTAAFAAAGWRWGGDWTGSAVDWMHFSTSGR